ncbi:hypothetical protein ANK1_4110 [plant metagenome]|uniref:Uncharacterized protein n=1 Tax=plant metagenome TaxID=1297885 RepID=A0A484SGC1_9ZZZZ
MANNYYDATGVLVLDQITPVITALFDGLSLDASYPGDGQAYIALISESNAALWDDIHENLTGLAKSLGLPMPDEDPPPIEEVLELLAKHFGTDRDEALAHMIEEHSFEDAADLDALFLIATRFNDGHNLSEIRFEGSWHCDKPRLFEFGGDGYYLSREFEAFSASGQAVQLGPEIRRALVADELDKAAALIARETTRLLAGVNDAERRKQLQERIAALLHASPA